MLILRFVVWMFSVGVVILSPGVVSGQSFPSKPVRIITSEPGGSSDIASRLIAQGISGSLGQQIIVENRPGIIAVEAVAKAPPDGYTLLYYGSVTWIEPLMRDNVPWDPIRDFAPITLVGSSPNVLVVHPSVPAKSVKELIALAKARMGQLNYGSTSTGSSNHLAAELFKSMAGVNIVRVPYKGTAQAITDLVSGQVQLMFPSAGAVASHIKSGKLSALAVTSAAPSALVPGLPTVAATGLPGYESVSIYAVFAPAKTPATFVSRLNQEIVRVLNQPDVKEKFFNVGVEIVAGPPEQLTATIKAEIARLGKVIKAAGIRAD